jgi:DHA3 family macrolide efflux protein-like MFS transporter
MISSSVMPLGMLLFGPLSDVVRIEWMLVATGLLIGAQAFFLRFDRALLAAGEPLARTKVEQDVIE